MVKRPIRQKSRAFGIDGFIWLIALSGQILSIVDHRHFHGLCFELCKLMRKGQYTCVVALNRDSDMKIHLDDPYWAQLVASSYQYERDFSHVLDLVRGIPYVSIDCGANYGYWSILLSSKETGARKVLAIEASPDTFALLQENCALNNNRFDCVNIAVSDTTGRKVGIHKDPGRHYSDHIVEKMAYEKDEHTVTTTNLDDVVRWYFGEIPEYLLVKLDVEGEEINALKGSSDLLNRDVLFYYEDHGNDPESKVTRYVLEELGLTVLFCTKDDRIIRIHTSEEASQYKIRKDAGYNFLACKEQSRFLQALSES
jgi:FkbM family methyltransferase